MEIGDNKYICRLCLVAVPAGYAVDIGEKKKTILEVLLIDVDLHVIENAVACSRCMEELQSGFEFKSACLHVDNCISAFVDADVPVDIKEVFHGEMRGTAMANVNLEHRQICRLCVSLIADEALDCNSELKDIIANCLPEVDIHRVHEPLVCGLCFRRMKKLNEFMKVCHEVDRRINTYCQAAANHDNPVSISPNDLLKYKDSTISRLIKEDCSNFDNITLEDLKEEDIASIESEEIHIKTELESRYEMGDSVSSGACNNSGKSSLLKRESKIRQYTLEGRNHFSSDGHRKYILARHTVKYKDKSEVEMHKCENCEYKTRRKGSLTRHILNHCDPKGERKFKCDKCPYKTGIKSRLRTHSLTHREKLKVEMHHKCENCDYETRRKGSMTRHILNYCDPKGERKFKCDKCPYKTGIKSRLRTHNLIHRDKSEVEMHKCESCEYESRYKYDMKKHMMIHRDLKAKRKFKCDKCPFEANIMSRLCRHNMIHKDVSEVEMHRCEENCGYVTKYKSNFKRHMMNHHDPTPCEKFKCDKCPFETDFMAPLRRHNLKHKSEGEMLKCDNCEYETMHKGSMNRHMAKHRDASAERKFKCDKCSYQTNDKSHLRVHSLIHKDKSEVEMHKCEKCKFETKHKNYMKQHMMKHLDPKAEGTFKCDKCPFETDFMSSLRRHSLRHTDKSEVELLKCYNCEYEAKWKRNLIRHIEKKHRNLRAE